MREVVELLGADIEIQNHFCLLEDRYEGSGLRFLDRLESCYAQLGQFPESGPVYDDPFRRLLMPGKRFALFYVLEPTRVLIHAVLDIRQSEESILRRLTTQ